MIGISNRKLNEASTVLNRANKAFEFEFERALREECAQAEGRMSESGIQIPLWTGDWLTYAQALNTAIRQVSPRAIETVNISECRRWANKVSDEIEQSFDISEE